MKLRFDVSELAKNLSSMENRFDAAIQVYAEQSAQKLENEAKNNARWTDRTGNARGRLKGSVQHRHNIYRVILAHGVNYGIWLELAHEKRFSIIPETIRYVGTFDIMPGFQNFMEKLR